MDIQLTGTGGPGGWPDPGCGCAPCSRARQSGVRRRPSAVLLDGVLWLPPGADEPPGAGEPAPGPGDPGSEPRGPGPGARGPGPGARGPGPGARGPGPGAGYRVLRLPGGWDITAPDGSRLLLAAGPGAAPEPAGGAGPYHAALLDLAGDPAQLGLLRRRRLVTGETLVAPVHIDHRVRSEEELARRCALWGVPVLEDGSRITLAPGGVQRVTGPPEVSEYSLTAGGAGGAGSAEGPGGAGHVAGAGRRAGGPWRVLLLGGARSGKSAEAELRLAAEPEVTYVATGSVPGADPEWAARVAAHRARRPRWWRTAETLDLAGQLRAASGALLVDGIGTWLAGTMGECGVWAALDPGPEAAASVRRPGPRPAGTRLADRIADLLDAWRHTRAHVVAVSDEAGSGVVPATASGRRFRDELGHLNQLLAAESEEAALMVAGRVLPLPT